MKVNDFSNIKNYNKIISIGNELLKFNLLVNYGLLLLEEKHIKLYY
jgi:hypothetical protein